jgi:hypothetical protein
VPPKPVPFETLHGGSAIRFLGERLRDCPTSVVVFIAGSWRLHLDRMTREVGQGSGSSERMRGYDQFSSLQFYILHIIYVVCRFVLSYYNMLYLSVLILQSSCLYCYLFISAIIHGPCLYTYFIYMIYMLHMLCVLMIHIVMDIFEIMLSMFDYLLYVIIIMLIYAIKMIWKMPIILTEVVYEYLSSAVWVRAFGTHTYIRTYVWRPGEIRPRIPHIIASD